MIRADSDGTSERVTYAFPPSPTSPTLKTKNLPLPQRLQTLRSQISMLEAELTDPANPELQSEDINAGELMRSLIDVRSRLEKIGNRKEGRGRLVEIVTIETRTPPVQPPISSPASKAPARDNAQMEQMDRRVRELENLLGSSASVLDDVRIVKHIPR